MYFTNKKLLEGDSSYHSGMLFLLSFMLYAAVMHMNVGIEVADDGAFFLRYADNMVQGDFWVWNIGEEPVWGASAPLYPLLVAIPILFGVSSVNSLIWASILVSATAFSLACTVLFRKLGLFAALSFLVFTSTEVGLMYFSASGLESPLIFLLLALSIYCITEDKSDLTIGVLVALLAIHKLDMIPAAGLLLACIWVKTRKFPVRAVFISTALCTLWYGFAWGYFGAPVPNSFITKALYQSDLPSVIDWTWFGSVVLLDGMHLVFAVLSLVLLVSKRYMLHLLLLGGIVITHVVAYSIKYPFEGYGWYTMPSVFCLALTGALGAYAVQSYLSEKFGRNMWAVGGCFLIIFSYYSINQFNTGVKGIHFFVDNLEHDRAEAGRWVAENTPEDFKVLTYWGNPAYFSKRYVYDGSFLNRKFKEEEKDLIGKFAPEILILESHSGSTPDAPWFPAMEGGRYRVVKTFDKAYRSGMEYFYAVLARTDIINSIDDVTIPLDNMRFIRNTVLGSDYGLLKVHGGGSLFIHPGLNTPTVFEYLVEESMVYAAVSQLSFSFTIADNVPEEAISRGGADVLVTVMDSAGKELYKGSVNHLKKLEFKLNKGDVDFIRVIVDSKGSPDTDWVILGING